MGQFVGERKKPTASCIGGIYSLAPGTSAGSLAIDRLDIRKTMSSGLWVYN